MRFSVTIFTMVILLVPATAWAGTGHLAMMYGVSSADASVSGAAAFGRSDLGAVYHNPAALADLPETALSFGYLYAQPMLHGGVGGKERDFREPNNVVSMGALLDVGKIFAKEVPLAMGINMLMDDNLGTMVDIADRRHPQGQFVRYGRRSFITMTSWGLGVTPWLNLGAGFVLSSRSEVRLDQDVSIAGVTDNEEMSMSAEPAYGLLAGAQFRFRDLDLGLVYRGGLIDRIQPVSGDTRVTIDGETFQQYPTKMQFTDGFVPEQWVIGAAYSPAEDWTAVIQGEWLRWSRMDDEYSRGDNYDAIDLETRDVAVPRLAVLHSPAPEWELRAGYAFEATPFVRPGHDGNVVLDADRHNVSAGAGWSAHPAFLRSSMSFDFAGFLTQLVPDEKHASDGRSVRASGFLPGAAISVTLKY